MQRPTGVTILAVLNFLSAALLVLVGIGLLLGGSMLGAALGQASGESGAAAGGLGVGMLVGAFGAVFCLIFAAISALMGWGMWTLKNWARIVTIVFAAIGALMQGISILTSLVHFNLVPIVFGLIVGGIDALIVWYLLQPHVKAAFEHTAPPPVASAAGV